MVRRTLLLSGAALVVVIGLVGAWVATRSDGPDLAAAETGPSTTTSTTTTSATTTSTTTTTVLTPLEAHPLPEGSGEGRRVVFSVSAQRMWWVEHDGAAVRTAAVSGREATPGPGTYQVYSRSERATGLDGSTMGYFVRFTRGENGWAIGFHDIPLVNGVPAQTLEQLGTPLSHGCIRQAPEDARFTWDFLQLGDTVVVTA